jgi:DNA-binding PadR family transcriptional regulator
MTGNFINPRVVTEKMSHKRDDTGWLKRGTQRVAVAQVIRKPMTATEICAAARVINPHIQLRDIWYLLKEMQNRNLVWCRNPRLVTGRLYELTAQGQQAVASAFAISIAPTAVQLDWRKYSWVVRAKIRRLTLIGLDQLQEKSGIPQTATSIRKHLRSEHGVALNPVLKALKDLVRLDLVKEAGVTEQRCCKLYRVTPAGQRIIDQLRR